jgi:hypothetical protein
MGVEGFPGWAGMHLNGDPGAVPPWHLRHAENVRFRGGNCTSRGGQTRIATGLHDSEACVNSLADFQTQRKAYFVFDGCPDESVTVGFSVNWFDHDMQDRFSRGVYYTAATEKVTIGVFDGRLYIGVDDTLKVLNIIVPDYGDEAISVAGFEQAEDLHVFTGFTITALLEFDGKLFIGLDDGAGAGEIHYWDGLSIIEDDTGIDPVSQFCAWRDKLIVGHSTSAIAIRDSGDAPGTYATVAGAVAAVEMISWRDDVYITEAGTDLWRYDGSTLAILRTVAGASLYGLASFDGFLFYGYASTVPSARALIGRLDSSGTFVDVHKDITAQDAFARTVRTLSSYRGSLLAGVNAPGGNGAELYFSPGTATSGTYTLEDVGAAETGGIDQALVF